MKSLITAAFITGLASVAQAEDTMAIPFEQLDANENGVLSIAEAGNLPDMSAQWSTLDTNGDGQLSAAEYAGYQAPAPAAGTK